MATLEASHKTDKTKFWSYYLPVGEEIRLGRLAVNAKWLVDWDTQIAGSSGYQATLLWRDNCLRVRRRMKPTMALNPVWFNGAENNDFEARPGDKFVIGETVFTVVEEVFTLPPSDVLEYTVNPEKLLRMRFVDPLLRVDALAELALIRERAPDAEIEQKVVNVLLRGVPGADTAALVECPPGFDQQPIVRCAACRPGAPHRSPRPHARLVTTALKLREPVLHVAGKDSSDLSFKSIDHSGWSMCVPLRDEASIGWTVYLTGRLTRELEPTADDLPDAELQSDLKFAELVAQVFGSIRQVRALQARLTQMGRFFNRNVLELISEKDLNVLLCARPTLVTVLFCDIRGSCVIAEQGQGDLRKLWATISEALEVMTGAILHDNGVVGDFQGVFAPRRRESCSHTCDVGGKAVAKRLSAVQAGAN